MTSAVPLPTPLYTQQEHPLVSDAASFHHVFADNMPPEDFESFASERLASMAASLWELTEEWQKESKQKPIRIRLLNERRTDIPGNPPQSVIEIVQEDMPFLVDSITAEINRQGYTVMLVVHPVVATKHAPYPLSTIHIRIPALISGEESAALETGLLDVLQEVHAACHSWQAIKVKTTAIAGQLANLQPLDTVEQQESIDFLNWLADDQFTFLGYRYIEFASNGDSVVKEGLGILADPERRIFIGPRAPGSLPDDIRAFLQEPKLIHFNKANETSKVHHATPMDVISIKDIDAEGNLVGEHRLVGLFTSTAYHRSPRHTPLLRQKVDEIVLLSGVDPASHDGKQLLHILETFPRDELFQARSKDLLATATGILNLQDRQRLALFMRTDPFGRFVSCLVYVPRDSYTASTRLTLQGILEEQLGGKMRIMNAQVSEVGLARLYFVINIEDEQARNQLLKNQRNEQNIEKKLAEATRSWPENLRLALLQTTDNSSASTQLRKFGHAFGPGYRDQYSTIAAAEDIQYLEKLYVEEQLLVQLRPVPNTASHHFRLKLFALDNPLPLSDILPILENLGLRVISERPHQIQPSHSTTAAWLHDFEMVTRNREPLDLEATESRLADVLLKTWTQQVENDALNGLVLTAGLTWRQVVLLRSYLHYLKQIQFKYGPTSIMETLYRYPDVAAKLVELFEAQLHPEQASVEMAARVEQDIRDILIPITSVADDRILYIYLDAILATQRTNYFLDKPYISLKITLDQVPAPRPFAEIFVYSTEMEAVHLRGGKVARGGIRWSDRQEDFRTEVLGLMKAQMVKNAVIVPTGSKGGFVLKKDPVDASREARQRAGIAAYQTMMRGLLDITDTIENGKVIPPQGVTPRDGDDPYLVVAADKGTASFSDIANKISVEEYGFWLGDAFASGGSAGYDHKEMGITAKGAWEAVKRHFRELGKNIQEEPFTVVGIGDMSGDVFGNGMLLSEQIKLQGAFNHRHIFIDPAPNPATSFAERERLFALPRSGWNDYDVSTLSKGGKIFDRAEKSLELTPEIMALLGVGESIISPDALIQHLLKHDAELLWFGGIGTYIRGEYEDNTTIGDKANDAVRIASSELRCKVIGEGANLGMTQAARIDFDLASSTLTGGKVNTDAIDNSAGVDCSDHEVNIKILLQQVEGLQEDPRNQLLESMTDEVSRLVLRDNYLQTQALSLAEHRGLAIIHQQATLLDQLEKSGRLDRDLEGLPSDETLKERIKDGEGLTRPELAVLLAYAKMDLLDELLDSKLPGETIMEGEVIRYFPKQLREQYKEEILQHPLKQEIIVTATANSIINRLGSHFVCELQQTIGAPACDIVRAYTVTRDSFGLREIWADIEALDNKIDAKTQLHLLRRLNQMVDYAVTWFLRHQDSPIPVTDLVARYQPAIAELRENLPDLLTGERKTFSEDRLRRYLDRGVPAGLAKTIAYSLPLAAACDIVHIAVEQDMPTLLTAKLHFAISNSFGMAWLSHQAESISHSTPWQQQALDGVLNDLHDCHRKITGKVLTVAGESCNDPAVCLADWQNSPTQRTLSNGLHALLEDFKQHPALDLSMLTVAVRLLKQLAS